MSSCSLSTGSPRSEELTRDGIRCRLARLQIRYLVVSKTRLLKSETKLGLGLVESVKDVPVNDVHYMFCGCWREMRGLEGSAISDGGLQLK